MKKQRRKHKAEFKARVASEAIRGAKTINEIAAEFEMHPVMVGNLKKGFFRIKRTSPQPLDSTKGLRGSFKILGNI